MPDLPTLQEEGVARLRRHQRLCRLAPARTPRPVIDKLAAAMKQVGAMPEVNRNSASKARSRHHHTGADHANAAGRTQKWTAVVAAGGKEIAKK